jgi:antirestriction protein ArdC
MSVNALYESVTASIIRQMETGTVPWIRPWKLGKRAGIMPQNASSGHNYRGINVPILWSSAEVNGYPTHQWMSFLQAKEKGATVRKGERATLIVFTKKLIVEDKVDGTDKKISMLRSYPIFNVHQIDGLPAHETEVEATEPQLEAVAAFLQATHADVRYGGDHACYVPSKDFIALPRLEAFKDEENYWATRAHETVHWTGHESRLKRDFTGRFGNQAYAAEELVAELGAAFLCAELGIIGDLRHAGYIEHWLKLLKSDDRAIFTAAAKASQAADHIRAFSEPVAEQEAA